MAHGPNDDGSVSRTVRIHARARAQRRYIAGQGAVLLNGCVNETARGKGDAATHYEWRAACLRTRYLHR